VANPAAQLVWHTLRVPRLARRERSDAVVSLLNFGPIRTDVPHVVFQRNALPFSGVYLSRATRRAAARTRLHRALLVRIMRHARRIVTPTAAMRDLILSACPAVPAAPFRVIPHAVDLERLAARALPPDLRRLLDEGDGQARVLYVSHHGPCKNFETLIGAVREARSAGVKLTLWLTIPVEDVPASVAPRAGDGVVALGMVAPEAVGALYRAADVFAFPSLCESFGFPMLEAMASGLPSVAADTSFNRELLGGAAIYHAPESVEGARQALERVLHDGPLRTGLQAAARARIAGRDWSWARYTTNVLDLVAEATA